MASPGFLAGLCLLLLNDFIFKQQFHNELTGKLSDFAGLFIFPLFWSALFPRLKTSSYVVTAILFLFWKSIYSQPFIDGWNSLHLFPVERTIDDTDLSALLVLPLSYVYRWSPPKIAVQRPLICFIAALSLFAFTATSFSKKTAYDNTYQFAFSKKELVERMSHLPSNDVLPQFWEADTFEIGFGSCTGMARVTISEKDKQSVVRLTMIDYRCPNGGDKQEMLEYFEKEFIDKLREEPVRKSSQLNYIRAVSPEESSEPVNR